MRIEHALGISGGARGVAEDAGGFLVELLPYERTARTGDEFLIGDKIEDVRPTLLKQIRQVRRVCHRDIELDILQLRRDLSDQVGESDVEEEDFVFGVIGNVD